MTIVHLRGGGALATKCGAVTGLMLSKNNVGFEATVTLSWEAASAGAGNPVREYWVYKNGEYLGTTTQTQYTLTAPESNASETYTVKAQGQIAGFDGPVSEAMTLTSVVTRPEMPENVRLSQTDTAYYKQVTLAWSASAAGTNNPVTKYRVYQNGIAMKDVTGALTTAVNAPGTDNEKHTYTVKAIGTYEGWDSETSAGATLTAHAPAASDYYYTSSTTFTMPAWAQYYQITLIGGGGGGGRQGEGYDIGTGGYGGSGGTGDLFHSARLKATPGMRYPIVVGAGGAIGEDGNTSTFGTSGGVYYTASGGKAGGNGDNVGFNTSDAAPNGGTGGAGCIGGPGGRYGVSRTGKAGNDGAQGPDWNSWNGWASDDFYCFADANTKRRLGVAGYAADGFCRGPLPETGDTAYGQGGAGDHSNPGVTASAGGSGLVAVRVWNYVD